MKDRIKSFGVTFCARTAAIAAALTAILLVPVQSPAAAQSQQEMRWTTMLIAHVLAGQGSEAGQLLQDGRLPSNCRPADAGSSRGGEMVARRAPWRNFTYESCPAITAKAIPGVTLVAVDFQREVGTAGMIAIPGSDTVSAYFRQSPEVLADALTPHGFVIKDCSRDDNAKMLCELVFTDQNRTVWISEAERAYAGSVMIARSAYP